MYLQCYVQYLVHTVELVAGIDSFSKLEDEDLGQ